MAYTVINFKTKKELIESFKSGRTIEVFQPGGVFDLKTGKVYLEGPHFPKPHKWYAAGEVKDGILISLQGVKR